MRRTCAGFVGLLLLGAPHATGALCTASPTTLCLNGNRFQASVAWKDSADRTGVGTPVPITADTGYFWFFSPANIELVVKVLDARSVNGKYWVFFGALSNVEYTLTVTDTVTGAQKNYVNPQGQFASVGDTTAFDSNGPAAVTTERVEGTQAPPESLAQVQKFIDTPRLATADFTPCPAAATSLSLTGCRFLLHVDWKDSSGRTGVGTGVQLTDDTGYFWFFTDTNVELMVKTLDARSVDGNFWVFFGALSDVQYTLTVLDTVTNVVRQYSNALGQFASVGDTTAFRSGRSVTAVADAARAVSQAIDATGGTLEATGADGTAYTLTIPANAIFFETNVTMTPLDHIDTFPFSGGLKGGVQLEPEGLILFQPATLTIAPPIPIPPAELAPFSYQGSGDDFILYPVIPKVPGIQLVVSHFSGYGAGSGTAGEAASQAGDAPSGPFAAYVQQAAEIQEQVRSGLDPDVGNTEIQEIFTDAFTLVVLPTLQALQDCDPDSIRAAMTIAAAYFQSAAYFIPDDVFALRATQAFGEVKRLALQCIDRAFERCKAQDDTGEVRFIMSIARQLDLAGLVNDAEYGQIFDKVERCLRFEVDFDSAISVDSGVILFYQKVQAVVPVRLEVGQSGFYLAGSGTTQFVLATLTPEGDYPCHFNPSTTQDGFFQVLKIAPGGPARDAYNVRMLFDPGFPEESDHQICPIVGEQDTPFESLWSAEFKDLHTDEVKIVEPLNYLADGWTTIPSGNFVAKKLYERSGSFGVLPASESTHIFLKHTPDAALP